MGQHHSGLRYHLFAFPLVSSFNLSFPQIWDLRVDHSVRSIFGPHVCGASVDVRNNIIVSGSWRTKEALQTWDFGTGKLINTMRWDVGLGEPQTMLYAACFNADGSLIAAGGSENNEGRVYETVTGKVCLSFWLLSVKAAANLIPFFFFLSFFVCLFVCLCVSRWHLCTG